MQARFSKRGRNTYKWMARPDEMELHIFLNTRLIMSSLARRRRSFKTLFGYREGCFDNHVYLKEGHPVPYNKYHFLYHT
jgi:hypothetical protein